MGEIIDNEQNNPEISDNSSGTLEAANAPQKEARGLRGLYQKWRKKRLFKKMDQEIRELSRTPNNETLGYFNLGISNIENAQIMAKEIHVIRTVLNKYRGRLSDEDREFLKKNFYGRVKDAGVVRQKGQQCELSDLERFERSENMLSPSPQRDNFFPNFKRFIENEKTFNIFKEPNPQGDLVNKIELIIQADRQYNLRYNEQYKGYHRKNNSIAQNLYLKGLENEWINEIFTDFNNDLKDQYERDPELKKKIENLREKFEYEVQKAEWRRLGVKVPAKKPSKEIPETTKEIPETIKKLKFRKSRTEFSRKLRDSRKSKQETPKEQGSKPLETWNNAKTFTKSEQQKVIDEFSTKYPEQYNRAMGNIEKEQREAREMAEEFSTKYPEYFNRAMENAKNTRKNDAPER